MGLGCFRCNYADCLGHRATARDDVVDEYWYPYVQIGRIAYRYFDIAIAMPDLLKNGASIVS